MAPATASSSETVPPELRSRVRKALEGIPGISEVRLAGSEPHLFVLLETHDLDRDRTITERLWELDLEYDLFPARASGMIPAGERLY